MKTLPIGFNKQLILFIVTLFFYSLLELVLQLLMALSFFKQMVLKMSMIHYNQKQSIHFLLIHPVVQSLV
jgi:hypothetical protein